MSDKTTEEAAEIRAISQAKSDQIHGLYPTIEKTHFKVGFSTGYTDAMHVCNTTIAQLREENERLKEALYGIKRLNKGWHGENAINIRNILTEALTPKPPKIKGQ